MRRVVFIILIVIFSSIFYFATVENENSFAYKTKQAVKNVVSAPFGGSKPTDSAAQVLQNTSSDSDPSQQASASLADMTQEQFQNWILREARAMDSTENNTADVEVRLRAHAKTATSEQVRAFVSTAVNSAKPANERIFSGYMATLIPQGPGQQAQVQIAKSALPDLGPILPHSEAELRHGQELSIRYMQVDELFARAQSDANARDNLKLLSDQAESPQVREYAARKLKELNP